MPLTTYAVKILDLAETIHRWLAVLSGLERANRDRVADYAEKIAATLARAVSALERASADTESRASRSEVRRELSRIGGYVETLMLVLETHLDGRKLAGVKRRLEALDTSAVSAKLDGPAARAATDAQIERLTAAEGYFRARADGLRT